MEKHADLFRRQIFPPRTAISREGWGPLSLSLSHSLFSLFVVYLYLYLSLSLSFSFFLSLCRRFLRRSVSFSRLSLFCRIFCYSFLSLAIFIIIIFPPPQISTHPSNPMEMVHFIIDGEVEIFNKVGEGHHITNLLGMAGGVSE